MNRMQELLTTLVNEGYPLTCIAEQSGIGYGRLYRCKATGQDLKHEDARKLIAYAEGVKINAGDEIA